MRSFLLFIVLCSPLFANRATEASELVTREEVNNIVQELRQDFDDKISLLKTTMKSVCRSPVEQGREKKLVLDSSPGNIAFFAQLTRDLSGLGNFQPIVYDNIVTNLGNGYDSSDGIFTAPGSGVYVFTWTNTNWDRTYMVTEIVVKGVFKYKHVWKMIKSSRRISARPQDRLPVAKGLKGHTYSDSASHDDASSATGTVVFELKAGDTVWIRSNDHHTSKIMGQNYSTFAGWLLYQI